MLPQRGRTFLLALPPRFLSEKALLTQQQVLAVLGRVGLRWRVHLLRQEVLPKALSLQERASLTLCRWIVLPARVLRLRIQWLLHPNLLKASHKVRFLRGKASPHQHHRIALPEIVVPLQSTGVLLRTWDPWSQRQLSQ